MGVRKTNNLLEVNCYNDHSLTEKKTKQNRKIVIVFNQRDVMHTVLSANVSFVREGGYKGKL